MKIGGCEIHKQINYIGRPPSHKILSKLPTFIDDNPKMCLLSYILIESIAKKPCNSVIIMQPFKGRVDNETGRSL